MQTCTNVTQTGIELMIKNKSVTVLALTHFQLHGLLESPAQGTGTQMLTLSITECLLFGKLFPKCFTAVFFPRKPLAHNPSADYVHAPCLF